VSPAKELPEEDRQVVLVALGELKSATPARLLDATVSLCDIGTRTICIPRDLIEGIVQWPIDRPDMRSDFAARNNESWTLGELSIDLPTVNRAQVQKMFMSGAGWRDVYAKFRAVRYLVQVSAPAYSADHQRALVYVECLCEVRCHWGHLLLLERNGDQWVVDRTLISWVG
jgi:hypothetical protein